MNRGLPSLWISIVPLVVLVALISFVVVQFGDDALAGASQLALILASAVSVGIGMVFSGVTFAEFEDAVAEKISSVSQPIIILLLIGAISGVWMISGIVPTMIYYGLQILNPQWFLLTACVICAAVSVVTGSSWTTVATIGVALMGIGHTLDYSDGWVAGAVISGAYFGDKVSPLSDTTVLASATVGTPLFTHIHYMMYTTIPTFCLTMLIFMVAGLVHDTGSAETVSEICNNLDRTFTISPWLLTVPLMIGLLIARRLPSMLILFLAVVFAGIAALIAQRGILYQIAGYGGISSLFRGLMISIYDATSVETGEKTLNALISTRGMSGMMSTVWLIICAMVFGGAMTATHMLESIMDAIKRMAHNRVTMVGSTAMTGVFLNLTTSDQYLSIMLTSSLYKDTYQRYGYEPRLLSRTCEDSATVTSVLIPWTTCGMTQSSILGISTLGYAPYCFFNIISPIMTVIIAATGWKIFRTKESVIHTTC